LNIRLIFSAAFLGMSLSFSPAVFAQTGDLKIGFVDFQRVLRQAPSAVKAAKEIENEFSGREQELQKMAKRLQTMQENMEKNALTLSDSERRGKEREFSDVSREFQRKQREFREDLSLRQNEALSTITDRANKAVRVIAEEGKFDLILQDAVWVSPRLDITEKVVKALTEGK
jgi:outer membrane protein